MSNCLDIYTPIVIPQTSGNAVTVVNGTNGADGAAILENFIDSVVTISNLSLTTVDTYTVAAGLPKAKDCIHVETVFYLTSNFVGYVKIFYNSVELAVFNMSGSNVNAPLNFGGLSAVELKARINFQTGAITQLVSRSAKVISGTETSEVYLPLLATSVNNTASSKNIEIKCYPTAGIAYREYTTITYYKKS